MGIVNIISKNWRKPIRYLYLLGTLWMGGAACSEEPNPYAGMTLEEVIEAVETPEEAQEFIKHNLAYDEERANSAPQRREPNGAEIRSFRTTVNMGKGVCRDAPVAIGAMLKDNGYPALQLDLNCPWGNYGGHVVFVYQDPKTKLWGTAGIAPSDFSAPMYHSLQEIVWEFTSDCENYRLYDLSQIDLVEGTTKGLVLEKPFLVEEYLNGRTLKRGRADKVEGGFESTIVEQTGERTSVEDGDRKIIWTFYTPDMYVQQQIRIVGEDYAPPMEVNTVTVGSMSKERSPWLVEYVDLFAIPPKDYRCKGHCQEGEDNFFVVETTCRLKYTIEGKPKESRCEKEESVNGNPTGYESTSRGYRPENCDDQLDIRAGVSAFVTSGCDLEEEVWYTREGRPYQKRVVEEGKLVLYKDLDGDGEWEKS